MSYVAPVSALVPLQKSSIEFKNLQWKCLALSKEKMQDLVNPVFKTINYMQSFTPMVERAMIGSDRHQ